VKTLFHIACFVSFGLAATAQSSPNFYVVSVKGSGFYVRDKYQIPVKIGSALGLNDRITLDSKSAVTLICNNYSLFTIANKNTVNKQIFPIRIFSDSCRAPQSDITTKFLKYLWLHFQEEDVAMNNPDANNIKEFGAAERGCADAAFDRIRDTIAIYELPFVIKYYPLDTAAKTEFVLFDEQAADTLYKTFVHHDRISISDSLIHLMDTGKIYKWVIIGNGTNSCDYKTFKKIGTTDYNSILSPFDKASFNDLSKTDQNKVQAFLLNEKNVVAEAMYYLKMTKDTSQNIFYKMIRENLKNEFEE